MTAPRPDQAAAFAALERHLASRRLARLDVHSRVVVAALVLILSGFFFWQVRVPLDGHVRANGAASGALWLAAGLGAFALAGAVTAAWRQGVMLDRLPGPEWLALPVEPGRVMRLLLSESRVPALGAVPPAIAVVLAGTGLMPSWWLVLLAVAFAVAWLECTRLATALVRRAAARGARATPGFRLRCCSRARPPDRALEREASGALAPRAGLAGVAAPRSHHHARARRTHANRPSRPVVRGRAARVVLGRRARAGARAGLCRLPAGLRAAGRVGDPAGTCGDPASAHRPLPIGLRDVWRARFTSLATVLLAVVLLHALLAHGLPASARVGLVISWLVCGLAVATLGLHYGITLQPRAHAAENLYFGWLGVTLISSWTIPLLGWGILIAGMAHSTMRLSRWWRPEVD